MRKNTDQKKNAYLDTFHTVRTIHLPLVLPFTRVGMYGLSITNIAKYKNEP